MGSTRKNKATLLGRYHEANITISWNIHVYIVLALVLFGVSPEWSKADLKWQLKPQSIANKDFQT